MHDMTGVVSESGTYLKLSVYYHKDTSTQHQPNTYLAYIDMHKST